MRRILPILMLASVVQAQQIVEVARIKLRANATVVAPIGTGDWRLPLVVVGIARQRSQLLLYRPNGTVIYRGEWSADAVGAGHLGGSAYVCSLGRGVATLLQVRMAGGAPSPTVFGTERLRALTNPRLLAITSRKGRPALVIGFDGGVLVSSPASGGRGASRLLSRPGRRFVGAAQVIDADGDKRMDLFLLAQGGRLVRAEANERDELVLVQDYPYKHDGVVVNTIAATPGRVWLGGERQGNGMLLAFDPQSRPVLRKFRDILKDDSTAMRAPVEIINIGAGQVHYIAVHNSMLVVGGSRQGRALVTVVTGRHRHRAFSSHLLSGRRITAFCTNPTRQGWGVAAATDDGTLHLLRLVGDQARPRDWDPAGSGPGASPKPRPGPERRPEPVAGRGKRVEDQSTAYFLRVEADTRRGLDTSFLLLYLGARPRRIEVGFYRSDGQLVVSSRQVLRRGELSKVVLGDLLKRSGLAEFTGYAVVRGSARADVVVEGAVWRGAGSVEPLRPFWR